MHLYNISPILQPLTCDRSILCSQLSHMEVRKRVHHHLHSILTNAITLQELPKAIAKFHTEVVEMKKSVIGVNTQDTSIAEGLVSDQVSYVTITKTEASYKFLVK